MTDFDGDERSIVGQFNHLCCQLAPDFHRAYLIQPKKSKKDVRRLMKTRLYNSLFGCLKGPNSLQHCAIDGENSDVDVKTSIWAYGFRLRNLRKFDEANKLEELFLKLIPTDDASTETTALSAVLRFLLSLADNSPDKPAPAVGHGDQKLPTLLLRDEHPLLPEGPQWYGESNVQLPQQQFYMHYGKNVFECEPLKTEKKITSVFDQVPGTNLCGTALFKVQGYLSDQHEKQTAGTLFGALVHGKVTSLEAKLDIPDLPDDTQSRLLDIRIPKSDSLYSMLSEDEGFKELEACQSAVSPSDSAVSPNDSAGDSGFEEDIWEQALHHTLSHHYTWETLGLEARPREKPFLTESGPLAFDQWYTARLKELHTLLPSVLIPPRVEVSERELVKDLLNVMLAVPSMTFMLDMTDQCFTMREGVYVSGCSPEVLQNLLQDFLMAGMFYHRLKLFSSPPVIDSFYSRGMIYQALTGAVRRVLQHYRATVLSISKQTSIMELTIHCDKLFNHIRYLADLCQCRNPIREDDDSFPTGVKLLSYLYHQTLEASFTEHYPMMLSVLQTACGPYLVFVQEWVYHGNFYDNYGEFMIQVNEDYLQFRDKHYWTHSYTLTSGSVEDSVPLFLKPVAKNIFICGKSINLLKACNPQHFMCGLPESELPKVTLTFSEQGLRSLQDQCYAYAARMQEVARQHSRSRDEKREKEKRVKQDLISKARQVASQRIRRVEDKMKELRKKVELKKKKELNFLKSQMESDLQRRAGVKGEEFEKDKAYMDRLMGKEEALQEEELELERRAREEIIAYYSQLSEEAARREQKALWRVRRAKLDLSRMNFLEEEDKKWKSDMVKSRTDSTLIRDESPQKVLPPPARPSWAETGLTEGSTVEAADLVESPEKSLPAWAVRGLKRYGISESDLTLTPPGSDTDSPSPTKSTPVRRSLSDSFHVNQESDEKPYKPAIQTYGDAHATKESSGAEGERPQIRLVQDHHATEVTEEEASRPHIKTVGSKHAGQESEPQAEAKPHLKTVGDRHANKPSDEEEKSFAPRLKAGVMSSTQESEEKEWKIKQRSAYGHSSEISNSYVVTVPKLKRHVDMFASKESDFTDFSIRPRIKFNPDRFATRETEEVVEHKSRIKMSDKMSATKESEMVDVDGIRLKKFQSRNVYGHSSDSSVEKLLYQGQFRTKSQVDDGSKEQDNRVVVREDLIWMDRGVEPYRTDYDVLNKRPEVDVMAGLPGNVYGRYGDYGVYQDGDVESASYLPLPAIIEQSITGPILAQVSLVNKCIVSYFLGDLAIQDHFSALRRYLCMADGDFSEILCDLILEKMSTRPRWHDLLNFMFLNSVLNKAIRLSINADDKLADNLGFALKYNPKTLNYSAPDTLDCLELTYKVSWPLNIVITENSLNKYSQVFSFMLQLKRIVWVLKDVWQKLKRDAVVKNVGATSQFRQLHLFRQEMQHFVKVMQSYISHQVVHVTWLEFQESLKKDVHNLDDLHDIHCQYLDKAVFRCLLNKKAASLMKVIQNIFGLILKFHGQLTTAGWHVDPETGHTVHSNFKSMASTYEAFKEYSVFLFKVVTKLANKGYHTHLHDLVLRLNFNSYYSRQ